MTVDAGRILFLAILCLTLSSALSVDEQHVTIGTHCIIDFISLAFVKFDLHFVVLLHRRGLDCENNSKVGSNVSISASQRETAARWASEIINNQTKPHLFSIGN